MAAKIDALQAGHAYITFSAGMVWRVWYTDQSKGPLGQCWGWVDLGQFRARTGVSAVSSKSPRLLVF